MSGLYVMVTVTDRNRSILFRKLFEEKGATVSFTTFGRGTATSEILDAFGLEAWEKAVIHTLVTYETFQVIKKDLERHYMIDVPGTGIVFIIPVSSIGGKGQLSFLLGDQEFVKGEESTLKDTEYELIVVIANQGFTEPILTAARFANAGGGTVIHAKGSGMQGAEKFFGFEIAEEKEMIYIVTHKYNKNKVMRAVMDYAGLQTSAQAVCFSLPVTATAGLRLIDQED